VQDLHGVLNDLGLEAIVFSLRRAWTGLIELPIYGDGLPKPLGEIGGEALSGIVDNAT
jgi:hypothetical protein